MSTYPSNRARLLDPDAHCIKFISTYTYDVCFEKLETVMNEMARGRMSANLLRIRSCMNIATHLRYRMLFLSENVNAEDRQFMTEYEHFYKFYLEQYQSPSDNASHVPVPKKTVHCDNLSKSDRLNDSPSTSSNTPPPFGVETSVSPLSGVETSVSVCSTHQENGMSSSDASLEDSDHQESISMAVGVDEAVSKSSDTTPSCKSSPFEDTSSTMDFESQDKISSCEYLNCNRYPCSCSCVSLNSPSMFHVSCVDLSALLEPHEPFSYRNEFGDHIEVHSPQKHIGQKRSRPETTSVDELISIYSSARRPADSSFSTWNFVDWRELLSWASSTLFRRKT